MERNAIDAIEHKVLTDKVERTRSVSFDKGEKESFKKNTVKASNKVSKKIR